MGLFDLLASACLRVMPMIGLTIMVSLVPACRQPPNGSPQTTNGTEAPGSPTMQRGDQNNGPSPAEQHHMGWVRGQITIADDQDDTGIRIDFVFLRDGDVLFFKWRPTNPEVDWSFELYFPPADQTVFGDLGDGLTVVDSRQQPTDGLDPASWAAKFAAFLKGAPADAWQTHLEKLTSKTGMTITVDQSQQTLPPDFADVDWPTMHRTTVRLYHDMLDRTIDK